MKVFITGATGFLGSHLCRRLAADGHRLTIYRRLSSDAGALGGLAYHEVVGDLPDDPALGQAVAGQDLVIHAAANLSYWRGVREAQNRINVDGTRRLVEACSAARVKKFLFVSSVAAIGIPTDPSRPADESFPFNLQDAPLNYPRSKWLAEQEVTRAGRAGLPAVIVNPSSIFGPFRGRYRGGEMIEKVRRGRVVPVFRGGINAVHVDDVVDGILSAVERGQPGERYILAGENLTFRQIAEEAARQLGRRPLLLPLPPAVPWLASRIQEPLSRLTGRRPRFTYDLSYTSGRFQFYDAAKAAASLHFHPRPFAAIVADYLSHHHPHRNPAAHGHSV